MSSQTNSIQKISTNDELTSMTSQDSSPSDNRDGLPTREQDASAMILKRGLYFSLRVTNVKRNAKVLFLPEVSHNMVSSRWLKYANFWDLQVDRVEIMSFQHTLYAEESCMLDFKDDDSNPFCVLAFVVDNLQEGIDIILGSPFERFTVFSPTLWEGDEIHLKIKERSRTRDPRFSVTVEGTLLPKQPFRLPLTLPPQNRG